MSEQEIHVGIIQLVPRLVGETDCDYFERVTKKSFKYDLFSSLSTHDLTDDYMVSNNELYEFLEHRCQVDDNYCNLSYLGNNMFKFFANFNNENIGLSDMIEEEFKNVANGI